MDWLTTLPGKTPAEFAAAAEAASEFSGKPEVLEAIIAEARTRFGDDQADEVRDYFLPPAAA